MFVYMYCSSDIAYIPFDTQKYVFLISFSFGRVLIIFSDCFLLLQNHSTCRFILLFKHSVAGLIYVSLI